MQQKAEKMENWRKQYELQVIGWDGKSFLERRIKTQKIQVFFFLCVFLFGKGLCTCTELYVLQWKVSMYTMFVFEGVTSFGEFNRSLFSTT